MPGQGRTVALSLVIQAAQWRMSSGDAEVWESLQSPPGDWQVSAQTEFLSRIQNQEWSIPEATRQSFKCQHWLVLWQWFRYVTFMSPDWSVTCNIAIWLANKWPGQAMTPICNEPINKRIESQWSNSKLFYNLIIMYTVQWYNYMELFILCQYFQ